MLVRLFLIVVAAPILFSCSKSNSNGTNADVTPANKTESLTYDFTENGCKTGSHVATNQEERCAQLQDNELNKNCALGSRQIFFKQVCPGKTFTPKVAPPIGVTPPVVNPTPPVQKPEPKKTVLNGPRITYIRSTGHEEGCGNNIFYGTIDSLFPGNKIQNVFVKDSSQRNAIDKIDYKAIDIRITESPLTSGFSDAKMSFVGSVANIDLISKMLNSGNEIDINVTDSPSCAKKDPSIIFFDLVNSAELESKKINLNSKIELTAPDNDKKCVVTLSKTLGDLIREKKPNIDLALVKIRADVRGAGTIADTGRLAVVLVTLSFETEQNPNSLQLNVPKVFLELQLSLKNKNYFLDQISQDIYTVHLMYNGCAAEPVGDGISVSGFSRGQ